MTPRNIRAALLAQILIAHTEGPFRGSRATAKALEKARDVQRQDLGVGWSSADLREQGTLDLAGAA